MKCKASLSPLFFALLLSLAFSGCTKVSYSGDRLKEEIAAIAKKEYGIDQCDVEMNGTTLGVFLPLKQLFAVDFKEALLSGKVTNLEQLFTPTQEAIDKVEDMLFSMSRVMLSTDKKIEFYYLQATDVEKTGMEISFLGNIDDVKKVRYWDIPRSEYRKRMIHDIQLNRATLWDRPIRQFFRDLKEKNRAQIQEAYFKNTPEEKWTKEFFFVDGSGRVTDKGQAEWELLEERSLPIQSDEVMVYVKAQVTRPGAGPKKKTVEYLFQEASKDDKYRIKRIIPMRYLEEIGQSSDVPLTKDIIYKSLGQWERAFKTPNMTMGDFLALQLTRRVQQILSEDERVFNTFTGVKPVFKYDSADPKHFTFYLTAPRKGSPKELYSKAEGLHEDVMYLLDLAAREFVTVVHSYGFNDWQYLQLGLTQVPGYTWKGTQKDLELYRKKKKPLQDILELTNQT